MAAKGCERLLPLPCGPGKHRPVECLRATSAATVVAHSPPPQSTTRRVGSVPPDLHAVAASSTCSASLSYSSFFSPLIQGGSRMRKSARTDLCGGRSVMIVPTASKYRSEVRLVNFGQQVVLLLGVAHASQALSQALTEVLRFDLIRFLAKGMS